MPAYHLFTWSPLSGLSERDIEPATSGQIDLLDRFNRAGCDAIRQVTGTGPALLAGQSSRDNAVRDTLALAQRHLRLTAQLLERIGRASAARRVQRLLVTIDHDMRAHARRQ